MTSRNVLLTFIVSALLITPLTADEPSAKTIVDTAKDAIVQVEIVWSLKVNVQGKELAPQEKKVNVNGTVITESGLVILSASTVTPSVGRGSRASIQADPQSVTYILEDGSEVDAEIALKDDDLDIMFVKPVEEQEKPFVFVKLEKDIKANVLDQIVSLNRLSTKADRAVLYLQPEVIGIVEKPRTYYVTTQATSGMPAFTKEGKCLGLYLKSSAIGRLAILPSSDILDSAEQLEE